MFTLSPGEPEVEVAASLGLVIGSSTCRVPADAALDAVARLTIVADLTVPRESPHRPSVRLRAQDGFYPPGARVWPSEAGRLDVDALAVRVVVDGRVLQQTGSGGRIRDAARLIADVCGSMIVADPAP
ncbi:MAG: fumarylacetoacetate hydrolase family protein [Rubrivivax sp.]|nr:fumarylacetoacetate hydrolase family protein [Rubrivivax sp.]